MAISRSEWSATEEALGTLGSIAISNSLAVSLLRPVLPVCN